jgi:DNA-binding transcriptional ArsR family regulator
MLPQNPRRATYWIERPEQIRAVASPIRQEIVDRIAALGPITVHELARSLGRRRTAIYHHLKRLERVGLVRAMEFTGGRGRPALRYETVAPRMRLARAARRPRDQGLVTKAGAAAAKQAARDYAAGFRAPTWTLEGPARNHWFFRVVATPSPARLKRINILLDELAELAWAPDPHPGPPISLAWFLAPLVERAPQATSRDGEQPPASSRTSARRHPRKRGSP